MKNRIRLRLFSLVARGIVQLLCGATITVMFFGVHAFAQPGQPGPPFLPGLFNENSKAAMRAAAPAKDRPFLIDVGSRLILPTRPMEKQKKSGMYYVQFNDKLTAQERKELAAEGVKFVRQLGKNAYLSFVTPGGGQALSNHPRFRGSKAVLPEDKLTRKIYRKEGIGHAVEADGSIQVQVKFLPQASVEAALTALRLVGAEVDESAKYLFGNYLNATLSEEQIAELAQNPSVVQIREKAGPVKDHNANSAAYSNTDDLQTDPMYSLDGTGVTIGMWESGNPRLTHQEYTGRVASEEGNMTDHGTHVAGTILASGVDPQATGMAPAAGMLHSYTSAGSPPTEMVSAVDDYGIVLSNNSWGATLGWDDGSDTGNAGDFGNYTSRSSDWDDVVLARGLVINKSSGNDRNDCDPADATDCDGTQGPDGQFYDNMGPRSMAKNIISVGAVDSATGPPNDIAAFSSAGPADDGRIKPDIVADGASLYSSCSAADNDYCNKGGTSMSTPSVTGSTALLFQHYRNRYGGDDPSVEEIKALLVNSAAERGRMGPDYLYGHGMLDVLEAARIIDEGEIRIISNAVDQDDVDEYLMLVPGGMDELRVTMTWLDPSGEESDTDHVFQNLDLELEDPSGGLHYPWTGPGTGALTALATRTGPNGVDNVEDAEVTTPEQGVWTARIRGTDVTDGPQNYALVANQDFSLPDQPEIEINFSGEILGACSGDQIERTIRIFNTGGGDLHVNSVFVTPTTGGTFSILALPAQPVIVEGGSHIDYTLRYEPENPIDDEAIITITSNDADEGIVELAVTGQVGEGVIALSVQGDGLFGDVMSGQTEVRNIELINEGICDLVVDDVYRTSGSSDFTVGDPPAAVNFPITLGAGTNFSVPIDFTPATPPWGDRNATVRVDWLSYPGDPVIESNDLDVSGTSSEPNITTSGDGEFGTVCGGEVAEREISVCNTGVLNTLHVFSASIFGDCDDFEIAGNPFAGGADISHDFCVPLTVRYTPTEAGSHMCQLHVISNDPDTPDLFVDLNAETPLNSLGMLADLSFDPTVIQSIGPGQSNLPLAVVNNGVCPVTVTTIADDSEHYDIYGEPALPYVALQPGEQLGDGALEMLFEPLTLTRELTGIVTVTYEADPITGDTSSVSADMCGEGVKTGARILVTLNGAPVEMVNSIHLLRKVGNTNGKGTGKTDSVDNSKDLPLQSVVGTGPACPSFQYHKEYGTVDNPVQLLPGDYELTITIDNPSGKGKKLKATQAFSVEVTDFVHTIRVEF